MVARGGHRLECQGQRSTPLGCWRIHTEEMQEDDVTLSLVGVMEICREAAAFALVSKIARRPTSCNLRLTDESSVDFNQDGGPDLADVMD